MAAWIPLHFNLPLDLSLPLPSASAPTKSSTSVTIKNRISLPTCSPLDSIGGMALSTYTIKKIGHTNKMKLYANTLSSSRHTTVGILHTHNLHNFFRPLLLLIALYLRNYFTEKNMCILSRAAENLWCQGQTKCVETYA